MWTRRLRFASVDVSGMESRPSSQCWRCLFMSHRVRRFLSAKHTNHGETIERSRTYTAGIHSHHAAHTRSRGPTVYWLALLPLEGRWLFCCITDRNLEFERPGEDTKVVTQDEKKRPFYICWQLVDPSQHLGAEYERLWFCGSWVWKRLRESRSRLNFLRVSFTSPLFSK